MATNTVCLLALAMVLAWTGRGVDVCPTYTDCLSCAGINGCGWCSTPILYTNGTVGPHCASPDESAPFTCNGIYSTSQCLQGYLCDQAVGACRLAAPGQGTDHSTCIAACTVGPSQEVYGCHNGSNTCVVVPSGTPGAASRAQCELHCLTPPAVVYACNASGGVCVEVPAGTFGAASKLVCEATGCNFGTYGCDLSDYQCKLGFGNSSYEFCDQDCRPPNDPCMPYDTCESCLNASPMCGWCSSNVTYVSGLVGSQCAGVNASILPFDCRGAYSTKSCEDAPTPTPPPTASPNLPPYVACPPGSIVLLQYNCPSSDCDGCNTGTAAECMEPHCTLYCSGQCQPVPAFGTSFMWSCNGDESTGAWTNATLVPFLQSTQCTGAVNPPGVGGAGTFPLNTCGSPFGPNNPPQYNTFMCVPCGPSCDHP